MVQGPTFLSLAARREVNVGSKSDLRAEISGSIVWCDALAPRSQILRSISFLYANPVRKKLFLRRCKTSRSNSLKKITFMDHSLFYSTILICFWSRFWCLLKLIKPQLTTCNASKIGEVRWVKNNLALHRSFQERGLQSDAQMLKCKPIQALYVTTSGKLIKDQVA